MSHTWRGGRAAGSARVLMPVQACSINPLVWLDSARKQIDMSCLQNVTATRHMEFFFWIFIFIFVVIKLGPLIALQHPKCYSWVKTENYFSGGKTAELLVTDAWTMETRGGHICHMKIAPPLMLHGNVMPLIVLRRLIWLSVNKHKVQEQLQKKKTSSAGTAPFIHDL